MRKITQLLSNMYIYAILGIICSFYFCCSTTISEGKKIRYNQNNLPTNYILIGKENILWDTGTQICLFFQDFAPWKMFLNPIPTHGYGSWTLEWLYYSPSIRFDSICINNIVYSLVNEDKLSTFVRNLNIMGIMGMNVIGRANWLIDFKDSSLHIMTKNDEYAVTDMPQLSLTYRRSRTPKTTLNIAGITINDILVDSGFDADIMLLEKEIEQINRYILPIDTTTRSSSGLYAENILEKKYIYHNITINGYTFDKLGIVQGGSSRRLIGMGFFQKFDKVFLNTKKKEFQFYKIRHCEKCKNCEHTRRNSED